MFVGSEPAWKLTFRDGTLILQGPPRETSPPGFRWDGRVGAHRALGQEYARTILDARANGQTITDEARRWEPCIWEREEKREPRPYQYAAVEAWNRAGRRGIVVMPTGSGKTLIAEMAIEKTGRPCLIVAPTLDLVSQWFERLRATFGFAPGVLGGGSHEIRDLTVSTYDSAHLYLHRYGDRFGLIVWDEVHHLPAPSYLEAARSAMAPFQLGLTATLERPDGRESELIGLVGPVVHRQEITELAGGFLSEYETILIEVPLSPTEREAWVAHRAIYTGFCERTKITPGGAGGFPRFLQQACRTVEGRAAVAAMFAARRIVHATEAKLDKVGELLQREHGRRTIIFTNDNATAYRISREFLVPCISHRTPIAERRAFLDAFASGALPALATSRVLNEGVDLPNAEVGIVVSGSGTVREHVQRLGRILRPMQGKQAILYELVAAETTEGATSARRRRHDAYR